MSEQAVVVQNLTKRYRDEAVVNDITFDIRRGEIFGLLGPNGAGKSTTIAIMLGLRRPTSGSVSVFGLDSVSDAQAIRSLTGYVMQQAAHDKFLTGRENCLLHAELYGLSRHHRKNAVAEVLDWAGLNEAADRVVNTYSGGMMRRLDLAISMLHDPPLIVLDEPTLGLDIETRRRLWKLIERMRERGVTIILTTHYLEEASHLCDRVGIIHKGRLVGLGSPDTLKREVLGEQHQLIVNLENPALLGSIDLPVTPVSANGSVTFSAPPEKLWTVLARIQNHAPDTIQGITYKQPTLDDVFLRLTSAEVDG